MLLTDLLLRRRAGEVRESSRGHEVPLPAVLRVVAQAQVRPAGPGAAVLVLHGELHSRQVQDAPAAREPDEVPM